MQVHIQLLTSGNLEMFLDANGIKELKSIAKKTEDINSERAEQLFIFNHLTQYGYKSVKPEEVGCLTSAPLITDGKDVWGYMDYQILAFLDELVNGKKIVWIKG